VGAEILPPPERRRYADAIVRASLRVGRDDVLVIYAEPAHRELAVAVAEAGYRAGARIVDLVYSDPRVTRARLQYGRDEALGLVTPWELRRMRELLKPSGARAVIGETEGGHLDGIRPKRLAAEFQRAGARTAFFRRANLDLRARWTGVLWPTGEWAARVYPDCDTLEGKRRLARDFLWFCRLTDEDGAGTSGWVAHIRALARRATKLTSLGLTSLELRGPGTDLRLRLARGTRWLGGQALAAGKKIAVNMPAEEVFTSPDAAAGEGTFASSLPLSFEGRLVHGLRGEIRGGRLVHLEADDPADRDLVAAYLDGDRSGNGRRLGEVALVDATSRIGQSGRTYFSTILDENAAAHIAFGGGFGSTRATRPARGLNRAAVHLDLMIGTPDFEVVGVAGSKRVPLLHDGLWQI
jgi:aminopeptidase